MTKKFMAAVVASMLILAVFVCYNGNNNSSNSSENSVFAQSATARAPRERWEYKVLRVAGMSTEEFDKTLNTLGSEGWELVTVVGNSIFLKRKLP